MSVQTWYNFGHRLLHWFRHLYSMLFTSFSSFHSHFYWTFFDLFFLSLSIAVIAVTNFDSILVRLHFFCSRLSLFSHSFTLFWWSHHHTVQFVFPIRTIQNQKIKERETNNKHNRSISMWSKRNQFRTTEHHRFQINKGNDAVMRESENEMKIGIEGDHF